MPAGSAPPDVLQALDMLQAGLDALRASLASPEPSTPLQLVSLKEAARQLNLHERTLRRLASRGAGVKIGGAWRVDMDTLMQR